jgi:hypothetical protein
MSVAVCGILATQQVAGQVRPPAGMNFEQSGKQTMTKMTVTGRWFVVLAVTLACCSCAMLRGGGGPQASDAVTAESGEAELKDVVRHHIRSAADSESESRGKLVRKKPYFFKEYAVYPGGPDAFDITMHETESITAPYIADVKVEKQRYATQFHRKKQEAKADDGFFRAKGTETLTYEFRNGKWRKMGSLFVAATVEENVNGEWVLLEEAAQRSIAAQETEEAKGWWGRTWSAITGR